ncbi:DUF7385 family protein [Natrarchaeobius chitinivorans]|uniref:Flagella cluster protein n=1 Tax=Natrarchaeobius chitinivorans TaxID=1679083 RepID=A0A3N6MB10_NATCH|nr:flagella cluster protein [Natrarchaeobius chitinivorans]RQG93580.1 flagella cluster protein [Natrarchaeobius chitinivorans]
MDPDFDVHDHRHQMKLLRDAGDVAVYENREKLRCPACSEAFDRLMIIERRTMSFPETDGVPFCLVRRDESLALFRH